MSIVADIADAVVAALNAQTFTPTFSTERRLLPVFDLAEAGDQARVTVVPRSVAIAGGTRTENVFDVAVDVGVQRRIDVEDTAQGDALLDLVEQIGDALRLKRLPGYPEAAWVSLEHEPVLAAEHLERLRVFTSVLTVTYRVRR